MAKKKIKKKSRRKYSAYGAVVFHEKRSPRSRGVDESKTAKTVKQKPTKQWFSNPATSDVIGIDTKKAKAKSALEVLKHLQAIRPIPKKDFEHKTIKKGILTYRKGSANLLQKVVNVRYNNVKIFKRKKKGRDNDYWISVLKQ